MRYNAQQLAALPDADFRKYYNSYVTYYKALAPEKRQSEQQYAAVMQAAYKARQQPRIHLEYAPEPPIAPRQEQTTAFTAPSYSTPASSQPVNGQPLQNQEVPKMTGQYTRAVPLTSKQKKAMGCLTVIVIVLALIIVLPFIFSTKPKTASNSPVSASTQNPPASFSSSAVGDAASKKAAAKSIDAQIYQCILDSENVTVGLQLKLEKFTEDKDLLGLYNLSKAAMDSQSTIWGQLSDLISDECKDYVTEAQYYVLNGKSIAENLMEYMDTQEMKYLSDATDAISKQSSYTNSVVVARFEYLFSQGFTAEEIESMTDAISDNVSSQS